MRKAPPGSLRRSCGIEDGLPVKNGSAVTASPSSPCRSSSTSSVVLGRVPLRCCSMLMKIAQKKGERAKKKEESASGSCSLWCVSCPISSCARLVPFFLSFSWTIPRILFASFAFFLYFRVINSCSSSFSAAPPVLGQLDAPTFLSVPPTFLLVLFASSRAYRWVLGHFLCIRNPTCRALVTGRTLALTNPDPPSSRPAEANVH